MIADLGTRKGAKIDQIGPLSEWTCGKLWMRGCPSNFPFSSVGDIKLTAKEKSKATTSFLPHWIRSCLKNVWAQSGTIRPPTAISFRFQVFLTSHSLFIAKYIILWVIQVFASICICRFHQKILAFCPLRHEFILKVSIKISDMTNAVTSIVDILVHLMISLFLAKLFQ